MLPKLFQSTVQCMSTLDTFTVTTNNLMAEILFLMKHLLFIVTAAVQFNIYIMYCIVMMIIVLHGFVSV